MTKAEYEREIKGMVKEWQMDFKHSKRNIDDEISDTEYMLDYYKDAGNRMTKKDGDYNENDVLAAASELYLDILKDAKDKQK